MSIEDRIPRTIWWEDGKVRLIDQSRLPLVGDILECDTHTGVCWAIKGMAVRGAPALGVAAALGIAAWAQNEAEDDWSTEQFLGRLEEVVQEIVETRPTAINLLWGAERLRRLAWGNDVLPVSDLRAMLLAEAEKMLAEDEERNRKLGEHGAELIEPGSKILTHCNAGSLATAYFGTALGVIYTAHEQGKIDHVWIDETRPVMQGARLTAWELMMAEIPCALITDSAASWVMNLRDEDDKPFVDAVIVGADRIAANGDVANKIGTYGLAILAHEHNIPFYVAAPSSSVDLLTSDGSTIPIEQRPEEEVTGVTWSSTFESPTPEATRALDALTEFGDYEFDLPRGHELLVTRRGGAYQLDGWARMAPLNVPVFNPAFDVTPARYITAIITERGVARPDYEMSLAMLCMGAGGINEVTIDG
ncbi:MAG: S-methyl-5-thioribose-1-phosphate isomerase [Actinomycetota bacterium]|nr:S-methyl-5-thioribose-1-phosphate isomerase [Actinomycetota bacterium]